MMPTNVLGRMLRVLFGTAGVRAAMTGVALLAAVVPASADVITYTNRTDFLAALGSSVLGHDYDSDAPGAIANGSTVGDFLYHFDPSAVAPAVVPGAYGGQALGGLDFGLFVGDNLVTLDFVGTGGPLRAFGADFYYGPSFDAIPGDMYRLRVEDGMAAGTFAGNRETIDPVGGTFFLGLLAAPGSEFSSISLLSVIPRDAAGEPTYFVPAYQVDNVTYQPATAPVPEPASTLGYFLIGGAACLLARRRTRRRTRT
jgi:hypothetical protein